MAEFEYNQVIEYIDGTFDENFNEARQWAQSHNTTFEEDVDRREEFVGKRTEIYQDPETGEEVEKEVDYPTLKRFWIIGEEPKPYVPPEPTVDELKAQKRAERDALMESAQNRIDRYRNQKELGVETTDDESTYKLLLQYTQYLRTYPESKEDWYEESPVVFEVYLLMNSEETEEESGDVTEESVK